MVKKGSLSTSPSSTSTTLSAEPDIALAVEISKRYCAKTPNFHKVLDSALLFFLIKGVIVFIYGLLTRDAYRTFLGGFLHQLQCLSLSCRSDVILRKIPKMIKALNIKYWALLCVLL